MSWQTLSSKQGFSSSLRSLLLPSSPQTQTQTRTPPLRSPSTNSHPSIPYSKQRYWPRHCSWKHLNIPATSCSADSHSQPWPPPHTTDGIRSTTMKRHPRWARVIEARASESVTAATAPAAQTQACRRGRCLKRPTSPSRPRTPRSLSSWATAAAARLVCSSATHSVTFQR